MHPKKYVEEKKIKIILGMTFRSYKVDLVVEGRKEEKEVVCSNLILKKLTTDR